MQAFDLIGKVTGATLVKLITSMGLEEKEIILSRDAEGNQEKPMVALEIRNGAVVFIPKG